MQRAVVGLAEECLGGAEETLRVFVVGLEGERLGERLFGFAVVAAIEQDLALHCPNLVVVLVFRKRLFADGAGFVVAGEEHERVHQRFAEFLTHAETSAHAVQYVDGFGVLVKSHVSLRKVNSQAAARLPVVEPLYHHERLVALAESPQGIA